MSRPYTVPMDEARPAFLEQLHAFQAVACSLDDLALLGSSRAYGWSRLDCLVHVRMGLEEMLSGVPALTDDTPDLDAASYWFTWEEDADHDPVPGILMTRRTAAAYTRPTDALEHLGNVMAGLRAAVPRMADQPVLFQGHVLSAGDLLATWAVELAVHHHDLDAATDAAPPAQAAVHIGRRTVEALGKQGSSPALNRDNLSVLLVGFGRL